MAYIIAKEGKKSAPSIITVDTPRIAELLSVGVTVGEAVAASSRDDTERSNASYAQLTRFVVTTVTSNKSSAASGWFKVTAIPDF